MEPGTRGTQSSNRGGGVRGPWKIEREDSVESRDEPWEGTTVQERSTVSSDPMIGPGSGESIGSRSRFLDSGEGDGVVRIVVAGLGRSLLASLPLHRLSLLTDAVVADSIFGEPSADDEAELGGRGYRDDQS